MSAGPTHRTSGQLPQSPLFFSILSQSYSCYFLGRTIRRDAPYHNFFRISHDLTLLNGEKNHWSIDIAYRLTNFLWSIQQPLKQSLLLLMKKKFCYQVHLFPFFCIFAVAYVTVVWNAESFCFSAVDCSLYSCVKSIYFVALFFL